MDKNFTEVITSQKAK